MQIGTGSLQQVQKRHARLKLNFLWGICNVTNFKDCIYLRLYFTEKVLFHLYNIRVKLRMMSFEGDADASILLVQLRNKAITRSSQAKTFIGTTSNRKD